jgi:glutathione S-transferase
MALASSDIRVELREVKLSDMPESMLQLSPKATVPVLLTSEGLVVDESLDVMLWSLSLADPQHWLDISEAASQLIQRCDAEFKPLLDCYKYADRHPELSQAEHRIRAEVFVRELDQLLGLHAYLDDDRCRLPDVAIFPFIRQFASVDAAWFERCEFSLVRSWLNNMLGDPLFRKVMQKYPFWQPGDEAVYL